MSSTVIRWLSCELDRIELANLLYERLDSCPFLIERIDLFAGRSVISV